MAWTSRTANITPSPPSGLYLSTSADRGASFEVREVQAGDKANTGMTGTILRWSPAGGETGSLHLVWEGKEPITQGDRDVLYRRSLDGGATWSDNDDDPELLYGQFHPNLRVAPNGRLDLAWWDQRDAAGAFGTDVYYASSSDAGASWSANQRMTEVSSTAPSGCGPRVPAVTSDNHRGSPPPTPGPRGGDDTRNGNQVTQTQDLYAASAQYEPLAATGIPEAAGYVLAVVIGVGVVGLILVIGSKMMGLSRRPPGPPATPASAEREPIAVG
ncbi:hypothetical protein BH20ACT1_BH20ACT1_03630 [soil metagenome]